MEDIFEELAAAASDVDEAEETGVPVRRDDEAEEVNDTKRVVKPKRTISRPRPKLDPTRLLGPRGIFVLSATFKDMKFRGKRHELDDLNNVLSRLQHWAHRLFPKMKFEDCIERIEELGAKREMQVNMHKLRMGMVDLDKPQQQTDLVVDEDDEVDVPAMPTEPTVDAFDQLVASSQPKQVSLTEEQRARMMRNRLLAEERRMARKLAREKELEEQRANEQNEAMETTPTDVPAPLSPERSSCPESVEPPMSRVDSQNDVSCTESPQGSSNTETDFVQTHQEAEGPAEPTDSSLHSPSKADGDPKTVTLLAEETNSPPHESQKSSEELACRIQELESSNAPDEISEHLDSPKDPVGSSDLNPSQELSSNDL